MTLLLDCLTTLYISSKSIPSFVHVQHNTMVAHIYDYATLEDMWHSSCTLSPPNSPQSGYMIASITQTRHQRQRNQGYIPIRGHRRKCALPFNSLSLLLAIWSEMNQSDGKDVSPQRETGKSVVLHN